MADRRSARAELERKRIQLAQMKQERERRLLRENENQSNASENRDRSEDADAVLQALGLYTSLSRASTAPSNVSTMEQARTTTTPSLDLSQTSSQQQPPLSSSLNDALIMHSTPKTAVPLQVVHVNQINIPPKERVYYTKSTQTPAPIVPTQNDQIVPQSDAPQQKSYYGKQTNMPNVVATPTTGQPNNLSSINSLGNTTQVDPLEWDDEFPGMSSLVIATESTIYQHFVAFMLVISLILLILS